MRFRNARRNPRAPILQGSAGLAFLMMLIAVSASFGQTSADGSSRPAVRQDAPLLVLSPKAQAPGWTGVHRPHTKLSDVLARHAGQTDWAETVVDDASLFAQWISMGPGQKTPRRMNGDTREWWIVQSGALEVNVTRARKLYPLEETPVALPGFEYVPTRVTGGRGSLDEQNRPVIDFSQVVAGEERGGPFVVDDRSFANIIIGDYQAPQPGNKGHFHEEGSEFWLIMLGKIRYHIEGLSEFEAD